MPKLGSSESATKILDSRLAVIRQWDKTEAIEYLLPQRIEDGKMINFKGQAIMSYDGKDCVFHEDVDVVKNVSRITDKFLNELYLPYTTYLGTASEQAKGPEIKQIVDKDNKQPVVSDGKLYAEIKALIADGDLKKAKKLLAKNEDAPDFKACKKLIKNGPNEDASETKDTSDEGEEALTDLISEVEALIADGKVKKAKKLLAKNEDHADYKDAKKLIKKAKGE